MTNPNELVWKARLIVKQDGYVDFVPDRQEVVGREDDKDARRQFVEELDKALPNRKLLDIVAEKLRSREIHTREAADVVLFNEDGFFVKGNSNASAGYFYVEARRAQNIRPKGRGFSYPKLHTYEEFMAEYDPADMHTTVIKIPRPNDDVPTHFIVIEDPDGRRIVLHPMPFNEYLDLDVHAFHAAGNAAPIGVMAMADGDQTGLDQSEGFPKLTGNNWPAGRLLALFVD